MNGFGVVLGEVLAGLGLALCLFFMLRLLLPARRRAAIDAFGRRLLAWLRRRPAPPRRNLTEREAARLAEEAIRRAREGREKQDTKGSGKWDGNVFRLRSKRPRKPH